MIVVPLVILNYIKERTKRNYMSVYCAGKKWTGGIWSLFKHPMRNASRVFNTVQQCSTLRGSGAEHCPRSSPREFAIRQRTADKNPLPGLINGYRHSNRSRFCFEQNRFFLYDVGICLWHTFDHAKESSFGTDCLKTLYSIQQRIAEGTEMKPL